MHFTTEQFFWTTLDIEQHMFFGEVSEAHQLNGDCCMSPGNYRVIDGEVFQVLEGLSPIND